MSRTLQSRALCRLSTIQRDGAHGGAAVGGDQRHGGQRAASVQPPCHRSDMLLSSELSFFILI